VLATVRPGRGAADSKPDFAKAIAFYPGCRAPAAGATFHARLPLLILIGDADRRTPAAPCRALADAAGRAGEPVSIVVYPGAFHDFDNPHVPVQRPGGPRPPPRSDPAAGADAIKRVLAFLTR